MYCLMMRFEKSKKINNLTALNDKTNIGTSHKII